MKIELKEISVRELTKDYTNNNEEGVIGYNGKLDIRPPYQREFIYKDKQREAVIDTITKEFPLNMMYWAVKDDGNYEIIDGQQRTVSICQYVNGDFMYNNLYFHNLKDEEQKQILNYKIMVYFCSGSDAEKLSWFETINIVGEKLTRQELRNAVYSGSWTADAKKYFSKTGCVASNIGKDFVKGSPIRQDYLEIAIKWRSNGEISQYMAMHQDDANASALWIYFQAVMTWTKAVFTNKRRFMKGIDWGVLYNEFKDNVYNPDEIEKEIAELILDDDVTKKSGIYIFILTGDEKYLSIRTFSDFIKQKLYEEQEGICKICGEHFKIEEMEADHIIPWHDGGKTVEDNCQMLCKNCNRKKSGK